MLIEHQHPDNRHITVAVLGAPNVGKSSLVNYMVGMDLSIVTHLPQTTRNKFRCVFSVDRTEVVLVDTPGLHKSNLEFNKRLNEQAREGAEGADLNLLLVDLSREVLQQVKDFVDNFREELGPTWLVFTKADKVENANELPLKEVFEKAKEILPALQKYYLISVKDDMNLNDLIMGICDMAPNAPHHFPNGDMSDKNERFFATEYIREQAFNLLKDELPYEIAVVIDEYKDVRNKNNPDEAMSHISASILVNRPSQRAIVVGSKGTMIKEIGTRSRKKIEELLGHQVFLNLHVKVSPKWFSNNFVLEELGIPRAKDSNRVWRKK